MGKRTFDARTIATLTTGIVMSNGFGDVQDAYSHMVGHDVWTHEMADRAQTERVRQAILSQYPNFPTSLPEPPDLGESAKIGEIIDRQEETRLARVDALSKQLLRDYPNGIELEGALCERTEGPIDNLVRMRGGSEGIIPVVL